MELWQQEALQALLETGIKEVEEGSRVYVSSKIYGDSRFHLVSKKGDGVQIEQTNTDEKWGSRVQLQADEIPAVLKTLLTWHLEEVKLKLDRKASGGDDFLSDDDALADLDTHPF
jgi:hypothetical protein